MPDDSEIKRRVEALAEKVNRAQQLHEEQRAELLKNVENIGVQWRTHVIQGCNGRGALFAYDAYHVLPAALMKDVPTPRELAMQALGYIPEGTPETWEEVNGAIVPDGIAEDSGSITTTSDVPSNMQSLEANGVNDKTQNNT
jgi:hypothetical protein